MSKPETALSGAKQAIRDQALALGFDAVGFAPAVLGSQAKDDLRGFVDQGYHGDMGWMAETEERRADPNVLWPEARSVIVVALNYGPSRNPLELLEHPDRGNVSVYARNKDYHDILKKRVKALARWLHQEYDEGVKVFVDTAPVMEKPLAMQAGVGWQGKHTNLVSREAGSWFFLGEVFTTLALAPDPVEADHCGSCRRCLDVCPTDAFPTAYRIDARRCISYLTIEHKGHIAREFRAAMGNRIYGCDDCLAVCPWNKFAEPTGEEGFLPRAELTAPRLHDLAMLDDLTFRQVFSGSPVKRIGRDRFVRNVLIAIGNSAAPDRLLGVVENLLEDDSPLVRCMAVWALKRLSPETDVAALRDRLLPGEEDASVREEWIATEI
jgi:epoxyqueuosine reductase